MAHIKLENISKNFNKIKALTNINLDIQNKEFFVLFGPAGAGKTTILKTIAGIERQDNGSVYFDDNKMNLIEPSYRNVSMVFENYALYPHLTVFDNIASPMRSNLYKESEETIKKKIYSVASMMKIDHLLERLPAQLSNGQRQRVALGRAIVRNPNVFLMDEPLAHLDAKLRNFMRTELKGIQQKLDTTTIYVTHDYMEAMSLGDRIGIINEGSIIQIDTPEEIYYKPCNEFVAKLLGEPEINILECKVNQENDNLSVSYLNCSNKHILPSDVSDFLKNNYQKEYIDLGIRGIDISYSCNCINDNSIKGTIYSFEPIGNKTILIIEVTGQYIQIVVPNDYSFELDSEIFLNFNLENAIFFDYEDKEYLVRHKKNRNL